MKADCILFFRSLSLLVLAAMLCLSNAKAQTAFAVATIKPSRASVPFVRDGQTDTWSGTVRMQDVTVNTCIKWAYGVQDSQIAGPDWLPSQHFDILARAESAADVPQMKLMMRALLADRFKLSFHPEQRELRAFVLSVAKGGPKLQPATGDADSAIQNSAIGFVARSTTMHEFADYIASPLSAPVVDETGLPGRYNFAIEFAHYLPPDTETNRPDRTDSTYILRSAVQSALGLALAPQKTMVEVFVVDHVEKPSAN